MAAAPNIYSKVGDHKLLMGVEAVGATGSRVSSLNEAAAGGKAAELLSLARNSLLFQR